MFQASSLYFLLCHKHHEEETEKETWKKIWLEPVLEALAHSNPLHRALIAEVLFLRPFDSFICSLVHSPEDPEKARRILL